MDSAELKEIKQSLADLVADIMKEDRAEKPAPCVANIESTRDFQFCQRLIRASQLEPEH